MISFKKVLIPLFLIVGSIPMIKGTPAACAGCESDWGVSWYPAPEGYSGGGESGGGSDPLPGTSSDLVWKIDGVEILRVSVTGFGGNKDGDCKVDPYCREDYHCENYVIIDVDVASGWTLENYDHYRSLLYCNDPPTEPEDMGLEDDVVGPATGVRRYPTADETTCGLYEASLWKCTKNGEAAIVLSFHMTCEPCCDTELENPAAAVAMKRGHEDVARRLKAMRTNLQ